MAKIGGKWALITGASSGFGVEFAEVLGGLKSNLILAARRTEPMEKLATDLRARYGIQVVVEGIDLTGEDAAQELKLRLDRRKIIVDILINNAGFGLFGDFLDQPVDKIRQMLQLNVTALTELTYAFASDMKQRRSGYILLVGSVLSFLSAPAYATYAATKGYVLQFGEALHSELKPFGIGVTVLAPGMAATPFADVAGQDMSSPLLKMMQMKARPVVEIGVKAMLARRATVVPGLLNKISVGSNRLTPRSLQRWMMGKMMKA
jgi:short-subunit dehydrogenase